MKRSFGQMRRLLADAEERASVAEFQRDKFREIAEDNAHRRGELARSVAGLIQSREETLDTCRVQHASIIRGGIDRFIRFAAQHGYARDITRDDLIRLIVEWERER